MNKWSLIFFFTAYSVLTVVMFILPNYTAGGYSILRNTTSQLGAQDTPNAWIMNVTFAWIGLASILAGWNHY